MPVFPIPDDWPIQNWACVIIEWPDSPRWLGLLRGLITTPARGRHWDGKTGSILDAQAIGLEIEERNPVTSCSDIVTELQNIVAAVEGIEVNSDNQVVIQTNIQNNINVVATAIADSLATQTSLLVASSVAQSSAQASSYAWSQAFAESTLSVTILNNVQSEFRAIEPGVDPDPDTSEAAPTGITDVLESTADLEICKRVYWAFAQGREVFRTLDKARQFYEGTVLEILGAFSDALWVAAATSDPISKRYLVPAAALLTFAHTLNAIEVKNLGGQAFQDITDWFNAEFNEIICVTWDHVKSLHSTQVIQDAILSSVDGYTTDWLTKGLVKAFFNKSSLASLYYVAPLLDPAPALPVGVDISICTSCLE